MKPYPEILPFQDELVIDNVFYRYPNTTMDSLQGINLRVKKGESVAFIGKSGAGKTTLVDVILGLLEATSGDIRVDGQSIYQNLRAWQNNLGYIPQSIFLTDESLKQNIAFGVPVAAIDDARIQKAIVAAQLTDLVAQLPQGLDTPVGERGVRLSGGQRQRVGIARALYHERDVLVLDEATSALDTDTEKLVTEAIASLSGSKTLFIIAHRLSTVEKCDRLYLLDQGKIVKSGTYAEVVASQEATKYQGAADRTRA
jgi:ABC-type multidrug transport system fused ATPase/permease subunit